MDFSLPERAAPARQAWITRVASPLIDPKLFSNTRFRAGKLVGLPVFSSSIGVIFVIPLMMSELRVLGTRAIGLVMLPGAISGVVFGRLGATLTDRRGNRMVMGLGLALLAGSLLGISFLVSPSPWLISAALLLTYIGFTLARVLIAAAGLVYFSRYRRLLDGGSGGRVPIR
jgi:DHA2 family metal-tetracycline-proton antiporter-like MFS transporter